MAPSTPCSATYIFNEVWKHGQALYSTSQMMAHLKTKLEEYYIVDKKMMVLLVFHCLFYCNIHFISHLWINQVFVPSNC